MKVIELNIGSTPEQLVFLKEWEEEVMPFVTKQCCLSLEFGIIR